MANFPFTIPRAGLEFLRYFDPEQKAERVRQADEQRMRDRFLFEKGVMDILDKEKESKRKKEMKRIADFISMSEERQIPMSPSPQPTGGPLREGANMDALPSFLAGAMPQADSFLPETIKGAPQMSREQAVMGLLNEGVDAEMLKNVLAVLPKASSEEVGVTYLKGEGGYLPRPTKMTPSAIAQAKPVKGAPPKDSSAKTWELAEVPIRGKKHKVAIDRKTRTILEDYGEVPQTPPISLTLPQPVTFYNEKTGRNEIMFPTKEEMKDIGTVPAPQTPKTPRPPSTELISIRAKAETALERIDDAVNTVWPIDKTTGKRSEASRLTIASSAIPYTTGRKIRTWVDEAVRDSLYLKSGMTAPEGEVADTKKMYGMFAGQALRPDFLADNLSRMREFVNNVAYSASMYGIGYEKKGHATIEAPAGWKPGKLIEPATPTVGANLMDMSPEDLEQEILEKVFNK